MSESCCGHHAAPDTYRGDVGYRRVLWAVLAINALMFCVEVGAGLAAGSASLQADALDFLGDAGNYVISLAVVGMVLRYRAMAALAKGATMGVFRALGDRRHGLACRPRHAAASVYHGRGRTCRARSQRRLIRPAVGIPAG
jgi:hypothetical protein